MAKKVVIVTRALGRETKDIDFLGLCAVFFLYAAKYIEKKNITVSQYQARTVVSIKLL